jgi:hypothetical protein
MNTSSEFFCIRSVPLRYFSSIPRANLLSTILETRWYITGFSNEFRHGLKNLARLIGLTLHPEIQPVEKKICWVVCPFGKVVCPFG